MLQLTVTRATALPAVADGADVWYNREGTPVVYGYTRDGDRWISLPDIAAFKIPPPGGTVRAVALSGASDGLVEYLFHKRVLPLALQATGAEVLHASGVATPAGAVAFCGASGVGKSTLAYALARRGYPALADDALAVEVDDGAVRALRLPFTIELEPESTAFFSANGGVSALAAPIRDHQGGDPVPLVALFTVDRTPTEDPGGFTVTRLRSAAAFHALLAEAYCFSRGDDERWRAMLQRYMTVAARVPVYRLRYTRDFARLPDLLDAIERAVR